MTLVSYITSVVYRVLGDDIDVTSSFFGLGLTGLSTLHTDGSLSGRQRGIHGPCILLKTG